MWLRVPASVPAVRDAAARHLHDDAAAARANPCRGVAWLAGIIP